MWIKKRMVVLYIILRLIRIYAPFISAIFSIYHASLFLFGIEDTKTLEVLSCATGHSILFTLALLGASRRMCKWYKLTCLCLLFVDITNALYFAYGLDKNHVIYIILSAKTLAVFFFILYRVNVGLTKFIRQ